MEQHKDLTEALVAFQTELPDVSKGGTNPAFNSRYATLTDVTKAVFPVLSKHGLAFITIPDETEDGPVLKWELRHVTGGSVAGVWSIPDGVRAQEVGSWITYGRRYCLSAVTGVTPDEDDDGNAASTPRARGGRAGRGPNAQERVARASAALRETDSLKALDAVWRQVEASGLHGVRELKELHDERKADLSGTEEPAPVDEWATVEVPK
jgi:hypothetical protein